MDQTSDESVEVPMGSTDQIVDPPKLELTGHTLIQKGYMLYDTCSPSRADCYAGAFSIESGKMLVMKNGAYDLIDETRSA